MMEAQTRMVSGWGSGDEQPLDLRRYFKELGVGHEGKRGSKVTRSSWATGWVGIK